MQPNPYRSVVLSAVSADESAGARDVSSFTHLVIFLTGTGTTSSGVITIEEADQVDHAGTWSAITTANASDVTGGATKAIHLTVAGYGALRIRVSTVIGGGGTITAVLRGI